MAVEEAFVSRTRFHICKGGRCRSVGGNKRSVLKFFASGKKELNAFIRTGKLDFKRSPGEAIVRLTAYYESLPGAEGKEE
jgi:hypothetical protein